MRTISDGKGKRKILLYGDVNLNILDGSAVWLVSMVEVLSKTDSHVTLLLKTTATNDRLLKRVSNLPNVSVISAAESSGPGKELTPREAAQKIVSLDRIHQFDHIIARGYKVCTFIGLSDAIGHKSWLYITDLPAPGSDAESPAIVNLRRIARSCRRLFAQTEDARSYLESIVPEAAGKTLVLTPMIPDEFFGVSRRVLQYGDKLSLVYSGKFAKNWMTLEMCSLPSVLSAAGIEVTLTMVGDKFQRDPKDPDWDKAMAGAISAPDVAWLGGMSREDAVAEVSHHDIGLSWRSDVMNNSFEVSTKVLEYAAAGVPPLLNRNSAHEDIFGVDYPLFLEDDSADSVIKALGLSVEELNVLRMKTADKVERYSVSASAPRIEQYFTRSEANYNVYPLVERKQRVALVGHDFKFAGELVESLQGRSDIELRFDHWETLHSHSLKSSEEIRDWADVIICEWCGPNAAWYSQNKRPGQKLIVRLHMFELRGPWMNRVNDSAIDTLVCVSELYKQRIRESTGWDAVDIRVIPNAVDTVDLGRLKKPESQFRIGLVGIVPFRKRPDRALDLLERLRAEDSRYTLHIRGRMPWEYSYEWDKPLQREAYLEFFHRIGASPMLAESVVFEPFGSDMGNWLKKIGYLLSPSTDESFHLAPAEGMASGAVPVFWDRPGVRGIFGDRWVFDDTEAAARFVVETGKNASRFEDEQACAIEYVGMFDKKVVELTWLEILGMQIKDIES